jgi:hypothetical protein
MAWLRIGDTPEATKNLHFLTVTIGHGTARKNEALFGNEQNERVATL